MAEAPSNPFDEPRIISDEEEFFETYKKPIIIGVSVVLIVSIGSLLWWSMEQGKQAKANAALSQASTLEEWQNISEMYPKTAAAGFALLKTAEEYQKVGNWEKAESAYQEFIRTQGDSPLTTVAELAQARSLVAQEKWDEAKTKYQAMISQTGGHPFSGVAHIGLAHIYIRSEEPEAARQILADLLSSPIGSAFAQEAEKLMKQLPTKTIPLPGG